MKEVYFKDEDVSDIRSLIDAGMETYFCRARTIEKHFNEDVSETSDAHLRYACIFKASPDSFKLHRYSATIGDETVFSFYIVQTTDVESKEDKKQTPVDVKMWEVTEPMALGDQRGLIEVMQGTPRHSALRRCTPKPGVSMHETPVVLLVETLFTMVRALQSQIKILQKNMEDVKAQSKPKVKECPPIEEREDNPKKSNEPLEEHPLYCRWTISSAPKCPETFKKVEIRVNHDALLKEASLPDTKGSSLRAIERHEYFSSMYVDLEAGALVKLVLSRNLELPLVLAKSKLVEILVQHDLKALS